GHRTFNIKCTGGIVESFVLETELESELEFLGFEFTGYNASNVAYPNTINLFEQDIEVELGGDLPVFIINEGVAADLIGDIFPDPYMKDGEYIKVKEIFNVKQCTQSSASEDNEEPFVNDGTNYTLSVGCHDNPGCNIFEAYRSISVRRGTTGIEHTFTVKDPNISPYTFAYSPVFNPMDLCGKDPSTLSFYYKHLAPNGTPIENSGGNGIVNSGHKRLNYIEF